MPTVTPSAVVDARTVSTQNLLSSSPELQIPEFQRAYAGAGMNGVRSVNLRQDRATPPPPGRQPRVQRLATVRIVDSVLGKR